MPKRDPMAEMYDMLQNTKQKREERKMHSAQSAHHQEQIDTTSSSSGPLRVIAIGVGLALIGFGLGQFFQQSSSPPVSSETTPRQATPTPTAPKAAADTQVIDRSTEKMTIRAVVPKASATPTPAAPKATARIIKGSTTPDANHAEREDHRSTEREIEELKDLKKELQELKAMKEQMKDNAPEDIMDGDASYGAEGNIIDGATDVTNIGGGKSLQGNPMQMPGAGPGTTNPAGNQPSETHY
jgi:hypothetical protein